MTDELILHLLKQFKQNVEDNIAVAQAKSNAIFHATEKHKTLLSEIFKAYENGETDITQGICLLTVKDARELNYKCSSAVLKWLENHENEGFYLHLVWDDSLELISSDKLCELFDEEKDSKAITYEIETINGNTCFTVKTSREKLEKAINGISGTVK